jgi:hypothetical protein
LTAKEDRWVARLIPAGATTVDDLLGVPLGLDVWERHDDGLVVAASEAQLSELERRRLARVQRLSTLAEFQAQIRARNSEERGDSK